MGTLSTKLTFSGNGYPRFLFICCLSNSDRLNWLFNYTHWCLWSRSGSLLLCQKRLHRVFFFFFLTLQILLPISSAADKRLAACSVGDVPACTIPPRTFFSFVLALARAQKADRAVHWPLHRAGAVGTAWALPAPAQFAASEILTSPRTPPKCWIPSWSLVLRRMLGNRGCPGCR